MELNLRRNKLSSLVGLGAAPFLQRLFLSSNKLATQGAISQLATASNLIELALDGNPVANEQGYRQAVVEIDRTDLEPIKFSTRFGQFQSCKMSSGLERNLGPLLPRPR
eukprot:5203503-Pleurochrysis_carterae.AAC.3